jgi:hypothetical protein
VDLWRVLLGAVGHRVAAGGDILTGTRNRLTGTKHGCQAKQGKKRQGNRNLLAHKVESFVFEA